MKILQLPKKAKLEILKILAQEENRLFTKINPVDFFELILDLRTLPSTDKRYGDARGDLTQHFINNNDWTLEEILLDRFNFLESDENFIKLLSQVISPIVNNSDDEIKYFYHTLNPILINYSVEFRLREISPDNLPIYVLDSLDENNRFKDIPDNNIPFLFSHNFTTSNGLVNIPDLTAQTYFLLSPTLWDDFGSKNSFNLSFIHNNVIHTIGLIKIISKTHRSTTSSLTKTFNSISSDYCSLGQNMTYYENLKSIFQQHYLSILKALNDVAFFTLLQEEFENLPDFKDSLIRSDEQEQLLRQARYRIDHYDLSNLYTFSYNFKPKYLENEDGLDIHFNFSENFILSNRIYALIGKNGVGKTQLVSKLPLDISVSNKEVFSPRVPLFSKIIAVSYSIFDEFSIPESSSKINYVYCGLRQRTNGSETENLTKQQLNARFFESMLKVQKSKRFYDWCEINKGLFSKDVVDSWIDWGQEIEGPSLNNSAFLGSLNTFSSGQSIFIYILTEILANIRFDSLIIFDEPETHLHPNAISQLINSIHHLVKRFQSYCIIATHSPIIVQGILSKNVYVVRSENGVLSAKHPSNETFGENLTKITEDIFGARETPSQFKKELELLVSTGYSFEQIVGILQSNNIPLSLNLTVLLKSMVSQ